KATKAKQDALSQQLLTEGKEAKAKEAVKAAREHPVRNRCTSSYTESGTRCNGCVFYGIPLLSYDEPVVACEATSMWAQSSAITRLADTMGVACEQAEIGWELGEFPSLVQIAFVVSSFIFHRSLWTFIS
ncbi:hypothetical protein Tco_1147701, partial [Tanacetum coccineum]